jgi:hypothetical protein
MSRYFRIEEPSDRRNECGLRGGFQNGGAIWPTRLHVSWRFLTNINKRNLPLRENGGNAVGRLATKPNIENAAVGKSLWDGLCRA